MAWAEGPGGRQGRDRSGTGTAGRVPPELYRCFTARADALSELCDAALCKQDRVHMLAELSLEPGQSARPWRLVRRAELRGKCRSSRLRWALAGVPLPAWMMAGSGWRSM